MVNAGNDSDGGLKVRQLEDEMGVRKVKVMRNSGGPALRAAAIAAALSLGGMMLASAAGAQVVASIDNWLDFGDNNSKSNSWDPGSNRSFARQWEQQPARGFPTLSPSNLDHMKAAIKRYSKIVADGGWEKLPAVELRAGKTHKAVATLRRRLQAEGDLTTRSGYPEHYGYEVEQAVRNAQERHGLPPTGVVDKATMMALNVPADARLRQLRTNLSRIGALHAPTKGRYVAVNIPAAHIEAVENDQIVSRHAGVVGKFDRQTPILQSYIHEINFNKDWLLPPTVIREDLLPKTRGKDGHKVFERYGIDVYSDYDAYRKGRKLDPKTINWSRINPGSLFYAQKPGEDNPLGFLKINFHNAHSVYMHDTPSKTLFARNFRAESSGCVRIQNIPQLTAWILQGNGWDVNKVTAMKRSGETLNVNVKDKVKLYFAYVTAWATPDGHAHFRRDLYRRDGVGVTATAY
jgi:murein L,D-transpeptidase YcbB/YkuD